MKKQHIKKVVLNVLNKNKLSRAIIYGLHLIMVEAL
jgi:hypothetical protein